MFNHVKLDFKLPELESITSEKGRMYVTPEGKRYPSITTVLGERSKAGILEWRKSIGEAEANRISSQASVRGTAVHKLAEDYLNNCPDWDKTAMPANLFSFGQIRPILDSRVNNIWIQEAPVYSDKFEMAGRVDCIAELDGVLTVIDFKTSRKEKKKNWIQNYFMQGAFYAAAFYERTNIPIKQTAIIIAVDDSAAQVFVEPTFDYLPELKKCRKEYREIYGL